MLDVSNNIISLPLACVRSGGIATGDGKASYVGYSLFGWSHMAKSTIYAYALGVNPLAVGFSMIIIVGVVSPSAAST